MKAVIWTAYGPPEVLQLQDVPKPVPAEGEVLIRIRATTVTAGDCEMRSLKLPGFVRLPMRIYAGLRKPSRITILGQELAGEVEAVGRNVARFQAGDAVIAAPPMGRGTYAEYICLPEQAEDAVLGPKPASMSYDEAAALPIGGLEALHFLRQARVQPGERLLINGAGGSIGTAAVQLARVMGLEVTAVDSTEKLAMLRDLGAEHVVDYTREAYARRGLRYDVIFDVVGKGSFDEAINALEPNGRFLMANPRPLLMLRGAWVNRQTDKQVIFQSTKRSNADLAYLSGLVEAGKLRTVIDRTFPLSETAAAHRYVESGRKAGNVIITVA